jgi:diadenosine tetraphosphate (Ap4A) HIT family hydrolase
MKRAAWHDPQLWRSLRDGSACPICLRGSPLDLVAEFPTTWVSAGPEAPLPGYACVVSKHHVVEPYELPPNEHVAFWEEVTTAAATLANLFQPLKMNYEIHGNVVPHLHVHLYPRYADDPYDTGALRPREAVVTRSQEDLDRISDAMRKSAARLAKAS